MSSVVYSTVSMQKKDFKFIDLFAGIGGFHQALKREGGECVFASEIDKACIAVYKDNYMVNADHDITEFDVKEIKKHDVLCGGFPCQAFSKAGKQSGFYDTRGTLFFNIQRILEHHHTKYIFLENVRNLVTHNNGDTWKIIQNNLHSLGYRLTEKPLIMSPHQLGIPQLRERVFILGIYDPKNVDIPLPITIEMNLKKDDNTIYDILEDGKVEDKYYISDYEEMVLDIWDEFYHGIQEKIIGYPIWVEAFKGMNDYDNYPQWKQNFVDKNKILYKNNKKFIDKWLKEHKELRKLRPTHRKFEWQAGTSISSVYEGLIQFRPSGIRVKRPTAYPALVAIVQIPIIGKYKRRLTVREVAKLQNFPDDFVLNEDDAKAYKQFGNSVNVEVINYLFKKLIELE